MGKNTVELIGTYSNDEQIACCAWTSTSRELTDEKRGRVDKLLHMLAKEGHHSPFERGIVHFLITSEISSHIHKIKHRIASINSESARYKELQDKFYTPEDWKDIEVSEDSKKKILDIYPYAKDDKWEDMLKWYTELGNELYHNCCKDLTGKLGRKRAKESARYFKTYNSQITCDVMMNLRSFFNFQKLRNSEHAQKEIREIAQQMLELVRATGHFKYTLEAFGYGS